MARPRPRIPLIFNLASSPRNELRSYGMEYFDEFDARCRPGNGSIGEG